MVVRRKVNPDRYEKKAISEFEKRKSGKMKFELLAKIENKDPVAFVQEFVSVPRKVKKIDISEIENILEKEMKTSRPRQRSKINAIKKLKELQRKTKASTTAKEEAAFVKKDRARS